LWRFLTPALNCQVLNILQTHYPERLANSLVLNVPFLIHTFFKMISPFIDPITRNKIKYNPKPVEDGLFAADELIKEGGWGGTRNFVWDHKKYWPQLVQMCAETRAKQMARWRKLGARVGCDEWDYKSEDFDDTSSSVSPGAALEAKADTTETTPEAESASLKTDDAQAQPPAEENEVIVSATAI
jgi:CRAL/TRIO domain